MFLIITLKQVVVLRYIYIYMYKYDTFWYAPTSWSTNVMLIVFAATELFFEIVLKLHDLIRGDEYNERDTLLSIFGLKIVSSLGVK